MGKDAKFRFQPKEVYWPEFKTFQRAYSTIVSKLFRVIHALKPVQFESLLVYLRELLKPDADLPTDGITPIFLMEHLQKRWDYLNTDDAEATIRHICENIHEHTSDDAKSLQELMATYKEDVRKTVTCTLKKCKRKKVKLEPPEKFTTMAVEITELGHHLSHILKVKDKLISTFKVGRALFAGWTEGCIVLYFFLPEKAMLSLYPKLESGYATLQRLHVTTVVVFDHFSMDVSSQQISLLHKVGVAYYSVMLWEVCEFTGGGWHD